VIIPAPTSTQSRRSSGAPISNIDSVIVNSLSDQRLARSGGPAWLPPLPCGGDLAVDPPDQIPAGNVSNEQIQRIGGLVQATVPEVMGWQRALIDQARLGAGPGALVVPAAVELPVAPKLAAVDWLVQVGLDPLPRRPAMGLHVVARNLVRDSLVAEAGNQPIEHGRRVVGGDCVPDPFVVEVGPDVVDQRRVTGEAAHLIDQANRVVEDCRVDLRTLTDSGLVG
jgi:hypothetical protein